MCQIREVHRVQDNGSVITGLKHLHRQNIVSGSMVMVEKSISGALLLGEFSTPIFS